MSSKPGSIEASKSTAERMTMLKMIPLIEYKPKKRTIKKSKSVMNKKKRYVFHLIKKYQNRKRGLNHRQINSLRFLIYNPEIDNTGYQMVGRCNRRTASRDLKKMVEMNILERIGKGRGTYYILKPILKPKRK